MLELNHEGRYIQGPATDKETLIREHGGKRLHTFFPNWPRKPEDGELVAVVDRGLFQAALWVQDEYDHKRVTDPEQGLARFYAVPREAFTA